jgi:hypothetical protein
MAYTGFLQFLSQTTQYSVQDVDFYFSFNNPGQPLDFTSDFSSSVFGNVNKSGFWSNSGSATFDGDTRLNITRPTKEFARESSGEFSFIVSSLKSGANDGVIFSSLGSGSGSAPQITHSGFSFGFNKANKFFFQSYDNFINEPIKVFINDVFPSKNSFSVSVSRQSLDLNFYDFSNNSLKSHSFSFNNPIHFSNTFRFGSGLNNSPSWGISSGWIGTIDDMCFSSDFNFGQDALSSFSKGMFVDYFQSGGQVSYIESVVVTGYSSGQVPLYSGITGYETTITGVEVDDFGNEYSGIITTPLYGITYGTGVIELTGIELIPVFEDPLDYEITGYEDLKGYGYIAANSLYQVDDEDHYFSLFVDSVSGNENLDLNKVVFFDRVAENVRYRKPRSINSFNLYLNGVFNSPGSGTYSEFNGLQILSGQYVFSGNLIRLKDNIADPIDVVVVEEFPYSINHYSFESFSHSGGNDFVFYSGGDISKFSAFFNGQKLASGTHFRSNSSGSYFPSSLPLFSGDSGRLAIVHDFSGLSFVSGRGYPVSFLSSPVLGKNHLNYSLNGIKLLSQDYILSSNSDFLTGVTARKNNLSVFINDNGRFFR